MQKGLSVFRRDVLRTNYPFCHTRLSKGKDASLIKFFPASSVPLLSELAFLCECVAEKPKDHWYRWAIFFLICAKRPSVLPLVAFALSVRTHSRSQKLASTWPSAPLLLELWWLIHWCWCQKNKQNCMSCHACRFVRQKYSSTVDWLTQSSCLQLHLELKIGLYCRKQAMLCFLLRTCHPAEIQSCQWWKRT